MRYTDIRHYVQKHFRERLAKFKSQVDQSGPIGDDRVTGIKGVIRAAESDIGTFVNRVYLDDEDALLNDFCQQEGITETLSPEDRKLILREYQLAYKKHAKAALDHNAAYDDVELEDLLAQLLLTQPLLALAAGFLFRCRSHQQCGHSTWPSDTTPNRTFSTR